MIDGTGLNAAVARALSLTLPIARRCPECQTINLYAVCAAEWDGPLFWTCSHCFANVQPDDERLAAPVPAPAAVACEVAQLRCPVCFTPMGEQAWWWTPFGGCCRGACAKILTDRHAA